MANRPPRPRRNVTDEEMMEAVRDCQVEINHAMNRLNQVWASWTHKTMPDIPPAKSSYRAAAETARKNSAPQQRVKRIVRKTQTRTRSK